VDPPALTALPDDAEPRTSFRLQSGLLVVAALVLHIPGFVVRLVNSDEASLATMAGVIDKGGRLYHQVADRKPPIVPYLYAAVFRITGTTDLRPVRLVAALVIAATAILLASEARRRYGSDRAALCCGLLFVLAFAAFFPEDSQAATFELFMLLPMTAAVIAAGRNRAFQAGLLLAVACLCKQTAITAVVPIAYLVFRAHGIAGLRRLAVGLVTPIVVAALLFGPGPFLLWTVTGNGGYLSGLGSVWDALARAAGMTGALVGIELSVVLLCIHAARRRLGSVELWLWLISGAVAVTAGFRFFGHYYLQLLPPAVLLATPALLSLGRRTRMVAIGSVAAPAVVCASIGFFPTGDGATIPYRQLAERVRAETDTGDSVFVWGDIPEIYWASGRQPATRFVHTGFLTGNSGGRPDGTGKAEDALPGAWPMLAADLARRAPDLIVDTSTGDIRQQQYYPMSATALWPLVESRYRLVSTFEGVRLYRLDASSKAKGQSVSLGTGVTHEVGGTGASRGALPAPDLRGW
jgi:hypothetical protein